MASAKSRLADFLTASMGEIVTSDQLREVAGITEWARRVRELRDDHGWPISTHNDDSALKPGEYRLDGDPTTIDKSAMSRAISQRLRAEVLDRDGFTCQSCGLGAGDIDPDTGRRVRLQLAHVIDHSLGGTTEANNLRAYCSACNQGAKNLTAEKPSALWLMAQLRRAGRSEQETAYEWLKKKLGASD